MKNHSAVQRCPVPWPHFRFPFFRLQAFGFLRPFRSLDCPGGYSIFIVFCLVWQSHIHSHSFTFHIYSFTADLQHIFISALFGWCSFYGESVNGFVSLLCPSRGNNRLGHNPRIKNILTSTY